MTSALKAQELVVTFDKQAALWDVTFDIPQGVFVGVIGPNGAGKTTLLRAALGLVRPISGSIEVLGHRFSAVRQKVAYVPQREEVQWDFPLRVIDVVLMGRYGRLGLFRWPRKADWAAARQVLQQVGMAEHASRQIAELSGGQQQRVFLARALLQEPELYLLDEPFGGVDAASEGVIVDILKRLCREGKTVISIHHDLNSVSRYFDWVVLLNMRLVACGPTLQMFTPEVIERTYGKGNVLLGEAARMSRTQSQGLAS
jgi:manganese/zinc/iron transport system ATP- binding protein